MQKVKIFKKVDGEFQLVLDCTSQFNPEKLKVDKKASWKTEKTWQKNIGNTTFAGGDPIKLSADLFFDTTNSTDGDVRAFTEPLMALTLVNLDEAAKTPSPEQVKADLKAASKQSDDLKKRLEDMEKSGMKTADENARKAKEAAHTAAQERVTRAENALKANEQEQERARKELDDLTRAYKDAQARGLNLFEQLAWNTRLKSAKNRLDGLKVQRVALEQELARAKDEERRTAEALAQKGPYEQALEEQEKSKARVEELTTQSKGVTAGSKAAPPICKFVWGDFSFVAIMDSVNVEYMMFRPDGTPIRAKAKIKMTQIEEETFYPPQNPTSRSAPRKVWIVQEGQRLDWIAYQEYGSPAMWRYLAEINKLDNPMQLRPGQILNLI
ncbi:MAG: hypothetical protein Kow0031_31820 [Anaerolineae bacterium]